MNTFVVNADQLLRGRANNMKTPFTNKSVEELVEAGKKIDVKVTPDYADGELVVNIRDYQFHDKIQAQIYLTSIAESELPHNHEYLIG